MKWEPKYPIDYSSNGDDIDRMTQKVKAEFEIIYELMNTLRQNFPSKSEPSDTLPFQWYVDTSGKKIYARNSKDDGWNVLGNIDEDYFGITAKNVGAVENDGTLGKFSAGNIKNIPDKKDATTNDIFFALDEKAVYVFTGTSWSKFLSLNFGDLSGYAEVCVLRDEVATNGKGKVLKLDDLTGKGNIDISGSADKILGYEFDIANLKNGQVLVFDGSKSKWTNKTKDEITSTDISDSGAANKIVKTDSKGIAHVSITGSASIVSGVKVDTANLADKKVLAYNAAHKDFEVADTISADITGNAQKVAGITFDTSNLVDGQFLKYKASTKTLISDSNEYLHEDDVSDKGAAGKIVRTDNAGLIHANLQGSASLVGGIEVDAAGIKSGQVLAYDSKTKTLKPTDKDAISESNISETGEVGKIIRLGADKTVHASVEKIDNVNFNLDKISNGQLLGYDSKKAAVVPVDKDNNATSINGIAIETSNLKDGQVLIYDAKNKKLVPADKDYITENDISTTGAVGKIIRVAANTPLNIDINGSANQLDGINVVASNARDGEVLTYRAATKTFRTEPKATAGEGKSLTITKGKDTVCSYNGSIEQSIDISTADKLSTARTIKLTGYAQGQVDFDGSSDVELNVTSVTAKLADDAEHADEADKLSNKRKIVFNGDATGEGEFDGSKNVTISLTVPSVASAKNAESATYATQATTATAAAKSVLADTATNAGTADKLSTARKITFKGAVIGEGSFDGSEDITINLTVSEESLLTDEISDEEIDAMF